MSSALVKTAEGRGHWLADLYRKAVLKKLSGLKYGTIEFIDQSTGGSGEPVLFQGTETSELRCRVTVKKTSFFARVAMGGSIGAGETYRDGEWECDDLTQLVQIFVANRELLVNLDSGVGALLQPFQKLFHLAKRNTVEGSKSNIYAHYDLGNDFFELFLDPTWLYSSGIFPNENSTLEEASVEKIDRICRELKLTPQDHLVEIGTGWGGFAIHAAEKYGCRVTTTTISKAQHELAKKRIEEKGLQDKITLLLEDYRNLQGQYDKLVSIEMIEAVGLQYLPTYFEKCGSLLKPEGSMMLQAIIIQDQFYEEAKRSVDFIQRHIFPGSGIPSIQSIVNAVAKNTDMRLSNQKDLAADYAKTLQIWHKNLKANHSEFLNRGYPEKLYRLWQYYFSYCEGGFRERQIGCVQMMFTKPRWRA